MMPLVVALAALPLLAGGTPAPDVFAELRSAKRELLVAEPYDLRLALVNRSKKPIAVSSQFFAFARIQLMADGEQIECETVVWGCPGAAEVTWETIAPGTEHAVALPWFQCFCKGGRAATCEDWPYRPGHYALRVAFSHHPIDLAGPTAVRTPREALDGTFESDWLDIQVTEPTGIDAEALTWARSMEEHPFSIKVINKFPTSTYAALVIYGKISLADRDPATLKKLIDQGRFPAWNSVPDPASPDGWSSLSGAELASWQVQQAERILREHPDFPYAGQLRLVIGVSSLRLGMEDRGLTVLQDLAKHADKAEGAWAKTFLSLSQQ
jgi:hypothetical protein